VPDEMWLTYLQLTAPAGQLTYDLAVSVDPEVFPTLADAGVATPAEAVPVRAPARGTPWWPLAAGIIVGGILWVVLGHRRPELTA
jgi:hypothetical protein